MDAGKPAGDSCNTPQLRRCTLHNPIDHERSSLQCHFSARKRQPPEDIDREELRPERSEVTKSGTDNEIAHHDSAFDPTNTAPESELAATENESKSTNVKGSLNMSPANKDVSAWRGPTEGGPDRNVDRGVSSKRGSPNKRRTIHVKEDGTHVSYR
ncbi:hypothetical protein N7509_010440 [Penicillium cosmopolitanum]|uniref:Uncharacterized protein n=1 Tax=Penicillium cosmopolitanum TaxID=1131564 RepID=A0A9W9VRM9_9EURO|nr:uncharacterized protein N7509_010440 [Penicillium cosmopolitanum]KAJ5387899.1 hypothetical protein N7509_010440 [Penicillium cosmopolitanum]